MRAASRAPSKLGAAAGALRVCFVAIAPWQDMLNAYNCNVFGSLYVLKYVELRFYSNEWTSQDFRCDAATGDCVCSSAWMDHWCFCFF